MPLHRLLRLSGLLLLPALLVLSGAYVYIQPSMPTVAELRDVRLQTPLRVFSRDGVLLEVYGAKRRIPVTLDQIPVPLRQAFIASEDARFREHRGVDPQALLRAALDLARSGRVRQGGSTITMQLARNFYLTQERRFLRKLREIFLALRIEQELSKDEILELYLNKIFLGHRAYGVAAAAEAYYAARPRQLTLAQMATIAGLPKAPSRLNPVSHPEASLQRRAYVLARMLEERYITRAEHEQARAAPITARRHRGRAAAAAPHFGEMVRAEMVARYGADAYTAGYTVHSTLRHDWQQAADRAVRRALIRYDLRHGWRGPAARLEPLPESRAELDAALAAKSPQGGFVNGVVVRAGREFAHLYLGGGNWVALSLEELRWARPMRGVDRRGPAPESTADVLRPGDLVHLTQQDGVWRLRQLPQAAGALVALDPNDGAVRALTGGFDFRLSKFNRAAQARRQSGSSFKPFLYSAALERGYTPATVVNDAPIVYEDDSLEGAWRPENYGGHFYGPTRLREALTHSRNVVSVRVLKDIGRKYARGYAQRFGFEPARLPDNLTLALGTGESTPLEMAAAFAVFANGGYRVEPYLIDRVENADGELVFAADPRRVCDERCRRQSLAPAPAEAAAGIWLPPENIAPRVLDRRLHYQMVSMLRDVVREGTARRAQTLGRSDLAGKTGTTNEQRDAWFSGFQRELVATAWVGRDDNEKLGRNEVGGVAALPMWIDFMRVALAGVPEAPEPEPPPGIVTARIDPEDGLLARPDGHDGIAETFREELAPQRFSGEMRVVPEDSLADMPEQLF